MEIALSIPQFGNIGAPPGVPTGGLGTLNSIIGVGLQLLLIGAVIFASYHLIFGGIDLITSSGDKEKFSRGRERIRWAIIGLIFAFLSFLAINFLSNFLGVEFFSHGIFPFDPIGP